MTPCRAALIDSHRMALLRLLTGLFSLAGLGQGESMISWLSRPVRLHILSVLRALESSARRLIYLMALETEPKGAGERKVSRVKAQNPPDGTRLIGVANGGFALCDRQWQTAPLQANNARPDLRISIPGLSEPSFEPLSAPKDHGVGLGRRLQRLRRVLDDLTAPAKRMARWLRKPWPERGCFSPLRPGRPPGLRECGAHPVDAALRECHALAMEARLKAR